MYNSIERHNKTSYEEKHDNVISEVLSSTRVSCPLLGISGVPLIITELYQ